MFENVQPVIGPYEPRPVECREYDSRAADVARQVAALIGLHLPQVEVVHVGSTAVYGCAGRGIVDLMIRVPDGELANVTGLLERLGFQRQTAPDPFPEDRPMWIGSLDLDGVTFLLHVHLVPADSPEVSEMRLFRACLRADPYLLKAYVARKREIIAEGVTDSVEYRRMKGEFIEEVLE
jgi:GrpB-like predicted nucleotidyltransferase (UPF0157 family)